MRDDTAASGSGGVGVGEEVAGRDEPGEPPGDIERRLATLWADVLEVDEVDVGEHFLDLGGDSLSATVLIERMRADFGLELSSAELLRKGTVAHCAALVRAGSRADRGDLVVPLIPEGAGPPLFLVHDITGDVLSYTHLVRHLGPGRRVFGIQARSLDVAGPIRTIEEQAATYAEALRAACPDGPYLLGGYSHGGPLAFEMARQLREAGAEVDLVVMFDSANYNPTPPLRRDARALARGIRNVPLWILDELFHMPRAEFRRRLGLRGTRSDYWVSGRLWRSGRATPPGAGPSGESEPSFLTFSEACYQARRRYVPGGYDGRVVLIRGRALPLTIPYRYDLGWGSPTCARLEIRVVPGGHNLLLPPFVARVAEELRDCLPRAEPSRVAAS